MATLNEIITPASTIALVLKEKTKNFEFTPYESKTQKWFFFTAVLFLVIGVVAGGILYFVKNKYLGMGVLISLLICQLAGIGYQVSGALPSLWKLRNVEREVSSPLLDEFNGDIELMRELSKISELHHLNYAKANYLLMAKQPRERISLLVGALDKVGIIPLGLTSYLAYEKALKDGFLHFGGTVEWMGIALIILYLFAIRMTSAAQWMEKISEIYEQAIQIKSASKSDTDLYVGR